MDPSLLAVVHELAPVLAALIVFACPVGLYWIKKNHELRLKELELEEKRIAAAAQLRAPERPELFEAPPSREPVRDRG